LKFNFKKKGFSQKICLFFSRFFKDFNILEKECDFNILEKECD